MIKFPCTPSRWISLSLSSALILVTTALICQGQQIKLSTGGRTDLVEASELSKKVVELHKAGKFDEALPLAKRVLTLRQAALGENDPLVGDAYANVGALYVGTADFEKALDHYQHALGSYTSAGIEDAKVAHLLDGLTVIAFRLTQYQTAFHYAERALQIKEKVFGKEHFEIVDSVVNLIRVNEVRGNREKSAPLYLRIISMIENHTPDIPPRTLQILTQYNCWLHDQKQNSETVALEHRIDKVFQSNPFGGQDSGPLMGGVLNGRALVLARPEYPAEARQARASGTVTVTVLIDECGRVIQASAQSGPMELRRVSEAAARQSLFSPTLLLEMPVKVAGIIKYNFVRH